MRDYIKRMKIELIDIEEKIERLEDYLKGNDVKDKTYLELCQTQLKYMLAYRDVLTERIIHESNKKC